MSEDNPTNSTLDVKLDYIQRDIRVIKDDVKEMKGDYISRREFGDKSKELDEKFSTRSLTNEDRVKDLYKIVYWVISIIGLSFLGAVVNLIIKIK